MRAALGVLAAVVSGAVVFAVRARADEGAAPAPPAPAADGNPAAPKQH